SKCLVGQAIQLTATGRIGPDGTVKEVVVTPVGNVAACVAGAIRGARFAPTRGGSTFHRVFDGDPREPSPRNIAPQELEANRLDGDRNIIPDEYDRRAIEATKRAPGAPETIRLLASVKLCIDRAGKVSEARILKPSGYPGYDYKIQTQMVVWEFQPFKVDGNA